MIVVLSKHVLVPNTREKECSIVNTDFQSKYRRNLNRHFVARHSWNQILNCDYRL